MKEKRELRIIKYQYCIYTVFFIISLYIIGFDLYSLIANMNSNWLSIIMFLFSVLFLRYQIIKSNDDKEEMMNEMFYYYNTLTNSNDSDILDLYKKLQKLKKINKK